jgi:hypothetical protein
MSVSGALGEIEAAGIVIRLEREQAGTRVAYREGEVDSLESLLRKPPSYPQRHTRELEKTLQWP